MSYGRCVHQRWKAFLLCHTQSEAHMSSRIIASVLITNWSIYKSSLVVRRLWKPQRKMEYICRKKLPLHWAWPLAPCTIWWPRTPWACQCGRNRDRRCARDQSRRFLGRSWSWVTGWRASGRGEARLPSGCILSREESAKNVISLRLLQAPAFLIRTERSCAIGSCRIPGKESSTRDPRSASANAATWRDRTPYTIAPGTGPASDAALLDHGQARPYAFTYAVYSRNSFRRNPLPVSEA